MCSPIDNVSLGVWSLWPFGLSWENGYGGLCWRKFIYGGVCFLRSAGWLVEDGALIGYVGPLDVVFGRVL